MQNVFAMNSRLSIRVLAYSLLILMVFIFRSQWLQGQDDAAWLSKSERTGGPYLTAKLPVDTDLTGKFPADSDLTTKLPVDPDLIHGKLENGLQYYIRHNEKPENRAQVWLAVNAGSILEDEDQLGLAHFVEHMAFNGTRDFQKHEIIDYLESIGMKFGPEINAYTGFDETVYMLQLPTDSLDEFETGFEILRQWASMLSFEPEEIEKERGVVIEEWRLGRGAQMRMLNEQLPVLLKDSRYAERLPIGKRESLETFNPKALKRFYRDWYRPDLMAVIAVGDFDKNRVEDLIQSTFPDLAGPEIEKARKEYPVPDHTETLYTIATDPEATSTSVSIFYKSDVEDFKTRGDYRRMLIEQLFSRMLNLRLYELLNQAEPPYLYSYISRSVLARTKTMRTLNVAVREDGLEKGLTTALAEAVRVQRYGFTETELERTKSWLIRRLEEAWQERDKTESPQYSSEYLRNFLEKEPVPGIEFEYNFASGIIPGIQLQEVNDLAGKWLSDWNRVIALTAPQKEGLVIPGESRLRSMIDSVMQMDIEPYIDLADDQPLMDKLPEVAAIINESEDKALGIITWILSNGIKVILKPTVYKNDEIVFQGFSPGGTSLVKDSEFRSARAATDIIALGGLSDFDLNTLNKKLAGKVASVFPFINELTEGVTGSCSLQDMETMFQLIYLKLTRPRMDSSAYLSYKTRMQGVIENRFSDPESAFYDTLMVTLSGYHYRKRPWSMEMLDEIDPADCFRIYEERFSDFSDYTFVFVGSFVPDSIRPYICSYLGNLPATGMKESWKDIDVNVPGGVIEKHVYRGIEPKSRVSINFTGDYNWERKQNYAMGSMASVLRIKLREILREELSGTYGASVSASTSKFPKEDYLINISFSCSPERVNELTGTVFMVIDSLKHFPVIEKYITKVRETQRRTHETNLENNRYWLSTLISYNFLGQDPDLILRYDELVTTLDAGMVLETAREYFNTDNYVEVVLFPAGQPR